MRARSLEVRPLGARRSDWETNSLLFLASKNHESLEVHGCLSESVPSERSVVLETLSRLCLLSGRETGAIQMFRDIADTRLNGIGAGTTRAGFWSEEQAVCWNHAEPATASETFELDSFVCFEIPLSMEVMSEKDTVLGGGHCATSSSLGQVSPEEFSVP